MTSPESELITSLNRIVECPICQERLNDGITLECAHSFCRACITDHAAVQRQNPNGITCPTCRTRLSERDRTLNNSRPSLIPNDVVDVIKTVEERQKSKKGHMCSKHPKYEREFFCELCMLAVCSKCMVFEHWTCRPGPSSSSPSRPGPSSSDPSRTGPSSSDPFRPRPSRPNPSRPETIEELHKKITVNLAHGKDWLSRNDSNRKSLEKLHREALSSLERVRKDVLRSHKQGVRALEKSKNELLSSLDAEVKAMDKEYEPLKVIYDKISATASSIREARSTAITILKRGLPDDIVNAYKSCSKRLKMSVEAPLPIPSSQKLTNSKNLFFEKFKITAVGRIRQRPIGGLPVESDGEVNDDKEDNNGDEEENDDDNNVGDSGEEDSRDDSLYEEESDVSQLPLEEEDDDEEEDSDF